MAAKQRHPSTVLHLEPKDTVRYKGKLYAATLQVLARDLDRVEGDYEIVLEVPDPNAHAK
jgi:hypothetical protein